MLQLLSAQPPVYTIHRTVQLVSHLIVLLTLVSPSVAALTGNSLHHSRTRPVFLSLLAHHTTSRHITLYTSHHITHHNTTSHNITLNHNTLHYIAPHHTTSHHITPHHTTSHIMTPHHTTSHYVPPHHNI